MSAMVKKVCFCRSGTYLYRKRMGEQAFYRWSQMSPIGDMSPWGHVHREALAFPQCGLTQLKIKDTGTFVYVGSSCSRLVAQHLQ